MNKKDIAIFLLAITVMVIFLAGFSFSKFLYSGKCKHNLPKGIVLIEGQPYRIYMTLEKQTTKNIGVK